MKKDDIYCNPLPIPDLGPGICCRLKDFDPAGFCSGKLADYREISDPELLWHNGLWYMFPSVRQAYVSRDLINWEYHTLEIDEDLGYAPSVCFCNGRFLLTASVLFRDPVPKMYSAPAPLGPYNLLGEPRLPGDLPITAYADPSLFCDDDGRLYLYWGCAPAGGGIFGMELDPDDPLKPVSQAVKLIDFETGNQFEHYGEYNEHLHHGWNEGAALFKHHGEYFLQYACCGTNFRNYALGCYRSKHSPLGPFVKPVKAMANQPHGIVNGCGHGGMVNGPGGTVWQFYTCSLRRVHVYERRIGMDQVTFDQNGDPQVKITSVPQTISGTPLNWVPVSVNKKTAATSISGTCYPSFAVDECTHTWWEPQNDDTAPALTVDLAGTFELHAARIIWCDPELDYQNGNPPEPVPFKIDFFDRDNNLLSSSSVDRMDNKIDHNIEFILFDQPVKAAKVRLMIGREFCNMSHGVTDFTLFAPPGG